MIFYGREKEKKSLERFLFQDISDGCIDLWQEKSGKERVD